jgi:superfamily II DNA or RNA helicase
MAAPTFAVTRRGVEIPKDADPRILALVRRELHVAPTVLNDPLPKKFKVFVESPTAYVVPLHWARRALEPWGVRYEDKRTPGDAARGDAANISFSGTLRAELRQPEAARAVIEGWKAHGGGAMLCLPVGFGKTTTALYLVGAVKKKTLVIVHKQFLAEQWLERVRQYLPGARTSVIQGADCDTSGDVVVAMIQTLLSRRYDASTFDAFGLTIADECHHIGAAAFSQCMWGQCSPRTLGLSATPTRKDGLSRVVEWFMGPIAFHVRRENQDTTTVRVVPYSCQAYDEPPPVNRRGDVCFTSIVTRLVGDEARTLLVAREVERLTRRGHDVLVLTHRRQHVVDIAGAVRGLGCDCGTYVGGDKSCPDTRVVVATYALTSEGFDLPRLNALVLATPSSDVEQSCGRVMRGTTNSGSVVVDIVDRWGVCYSQYAKRRAFYRRTGFVVRDDDSQSDQPAAQQAFGFVDE